MLTNLFLISLKPEVFWLRTEFLFHLELVTKPLASPSFSSDVTSFLLRNFVLFSVRNNSDVTRFLLRNFVLYFICQERQWRQQNGQRQVLYFTRIEANLGPAFTLCLSQCYGVRSRLFWGLRQFLSQALVRARACLFV